MSDQANLQQTQDEKEEVVSGGVGGKEVEPAVAPVDGEKVEVREISTPEEVPSEVEGWVERVKRGEDVHLAEPVVHKGETLVGSSKSKTVRVMLPLTEEGVKKGLHYKVYDSVRWLAEFCVRLLKIPGKAIYKKR